LGLSDQGGEHQGGLIAQNGMRCVPALAVRLSGVLFDRRGGTQQDEVGIVMPSDLAACYFTTTVVPTDTRL
jgi:hypothetical protein